VHKQGGKLENTNFELNYHISTLYIECVFVQGFSTRQDLPEGTEQ